jgi:hypothetical protein
MQIVQDEINWGIQHELIVFWAIFTEWPTNSFLYKIMQTDE